MMRQSETNFPLIFLLLCNAGSSRKPTDKFQGNVSVSFIKSLTEVSAFQSICGNEEYWKTITVYLNRNYVNLRWVHSVFYGILIAGVECCLVVASSNLFIVLNGARLFSINFDFWKPNVYSISVQAYRIAWSASPPFNIWLKDFQSKIGWLWKAISETRFF